MGSVELITRIEIAIAKRIEDGIRQVMSALVQYPTIVRQLIEQYDYAVEQGSRISDSITGFFEDSETVNTPMPIAQPKAEEETKEKEKDKSESKKDQEENNESGERGENGNGGGDENLFDNGPDPVITAEHIDTLRKLLKKYENALKNMTESTKHC